jgi:uncharacterized membrane protein YphA (DoxX/SURF4 family)
VGAGGRVHSRISRIWPNCAVQAELSLRIVLACMWAYAGNQTWTNCTMGACIRGCSGNQLDP